MMNSENSGSADKSGQDKEFKKSATKNINKNYVKSKPHKTYLRDKRAPKPPLNGYIRFLNDRRQQYCSQSSNSSFSEITKALATEWNQMPADKKQPYLLAAEQERVKYIEELEAYKKTDAYRNFLEFKSNRIKYDIAIQKERKLKKEQPSHDNKFKKDQKLKKEQPSHDNKFKKDQKLKKEQPSHDNTFEKDQKLKKEQPSHDNTFEKDKKLKKEQPSHDNTFEKDKKLKKEQPSHDNTFKKDQKLKKEQPSHDNKFKKDQELKKEIPSTSSSGNQELKKGKLSIPSDNSNAANDITIFTEEFLNFNKARDSELRNLRAKVTDQKQEVCVLDKHIENMEHVGTKLVANNEQLSAECSKYEQYLIKLRSKLLNAFANIAFPDNTEPPTHENIDTYIINYSTHQTTGTDTDPSWITCFKNGLSNMGPS